MPQVRKNNYNYEKNVKTFHNKNGTKLNFMKIFDSNVFQI